MISTSEGMNTELFIILNGYILNTREYYMDTDIFPVHSSFVQSRTKSKQIYCSIKNFPTEAITYSGSHIHGSKIISKNILTYVKYTPYDLLDESPIFLLSSPHTTHQFNNAPNVSIEKCVYNITEFLWFIKTLVTCTRTIIKIYGGDYELGS